MDELWSKWTTVNIYEVKLKWKWELDCTSGRILTYTYTSNWACAICSYVCKSVHVCVKNHIAIKWSALTYDLHQFRFAIICMKLIVFFLWYCNFILLVFDIYIYIHIYVFVCEKKSAWKYKFLNAQSTYIYCTKHINLWLKQICGLLPQGFSQHSSCDLKPCSLEASCPDTAS